MTMCSPSKNLVALVESFEHEGQVFIVTKYAKGGNLLSYLNDKGLDCLEEARAKHVIRQIAQGVADMHSNGFVHRDLKHLNIFMGDSSATPKVKVGDLGLTCRLGQDEMIVKRAGTIAFMAPEIVKDEPSDFKADVWSLGVITYALICSLVPFNGATKEETSAKILK